MVSGSLPPDRCGVGDYVDRLAVALQDTGKVEIAFASSTTCDAGSDRHIVVRMATWRIGGLYRLVRAIHRSDADIVHVQYPTAGYDAVWLPSLIPALSWLLGKAVVSTFHEVQSWNEVRHPRSTLRFLLHVFGPGRIVVTRAAFRAALHPVLNRVSATVRMRHIPIASNIGRSALTDEARQRLREEYVGDRCRLIAYFGFVAPNKGIEDLLEAIDPLTDRLLVLASLDVDDPYHRLVRSRVDRLGSAAIVMGYRPAAEVADLLHAADAVVLPFRDGASDTNGTVHAAALQGTYVLTTAADDRATDDPIRNIERVPRGDLAALRAALARHAGRRVSPAATADDDAWRAVAQSHLNLYAELVSAH